MSALPIQFDQPYWLLLLLLIAPCFFIARRSIGNGGQRMAVHRERYVNALESEQRGYDVDQIDCEDPRKRQPRDRAAPEPQICLIEAFFPGRE